MCVIDRNGKNIITNSSGNTIVILECIDGRKWISDTPITIIKKAEDGQYDNIFNVKLEDLIESNPVEFSGNNVNSEFGYSADINDNGNLIVIGAPNYRYSGNNKNIGAFFTINIHDNGAITLSDPILIPTLKANTRFGEDIEISNDGNQILVFTSSKGIGYNYIKVEEPELQPYWRLLNKID